MDIGAFTPFLYTFEEREKIYRLHEAYTGARITTSATRVGGMMSEMPPGWDQGVRDFCNGLPRTLDECETLLNENGLVLGRTQGVGVISGPRTRELRAHRRQPPGKRCALRCSQGPALLRLRDLRLRESPSVSTVTATTGTWFAWRRCGRASGSSTRPWTGFRRPTGPMNVPDPRISLPSKTDAMSDMESMIHHFKLITEGIHAPPGESYFPVEASKGELGMYVVSDGGSKPVRWRVRPPSFVNLSVLPRLLEGHLIADLITINASIDIVLGEIDR